MPIKSGRYFIISCRHDGKNLAYLPNSNSREPLRAKFQENDLGEQWDVTNCNNGHHSIQNVRHKTYATSGSRSEEDAQVTGEDSKEGGQMWLIQKTHGKGRSYTISTTDSTSQLFLGWGLADNQQGTPVTLTSAPTDSSNWWMFKDVNTGKDAEVEGLTSRNKAIRNDIGKRDGFRLLKNHVATAAVHNSAERLDAPQCYPKTREAIMDVLFKWIEMFKSDKEWIIWLNGAAGAGKSAIMQTLAILCEEKDIPLASFFFSRTDPNRNKMGPLIATLAYQLMLEIPETQDAIIEAIEGNPLLFENSLESQLRQLIIYPLINQNLAFLLVMIDGLDECTNQAHQSSLIKILGKLCRGQNIRLLFLIASRREPHIQMLFENPSDIPLALALDDYVDQSWKDIRFFLDEKFAQLKASHLFKHRLTEDWPSPSVIDQIVVKSSGQFIYASIVMDYLSSPNSHPARQLDIIDGLKLRDPSAEHPLANLDALYSYIFSQVNTIEKVLNILAFPLLAGESRVDTIEWACQFESGDVEISLANLASVIACRNSPTIRFLHASLSDFLLDKSRSDIYHINSDHSTRLVYKLLKLPTEPLREHTRTRLLISLLGTASPTNQLYDDLLSFCFIFNQDVDTPNFAVKLCMDFFQCFDRLGFGKQRKIYHHFGDMFASDIAGVWTSVGEEIRTLVDNKYPEFLDALYRHMFSQFKGEAADRVFEILTFPLLADEYRVDVIEWASALQPYGVETSLANLTSIITCTDSPLVQSESTSFSACRDRSPTIRFLHASLRDFLLDKTRSGIYHINSDHSTRLACKLLKLPMETVREPDRTELLISLLGTASPTVELYDSLLRYHFTFDQAVDTPNFIFKLCMDFFRHFDRLKFTDRRPLYNHFSTLFAPHLADAWQSIPEETRTELLDKYPEFQQCINRHLEEGKLNLSRTVARIHPYPLLLSLALPLPFIFAGLFRGWYS